MPAASVGRCPFSIVGSKGLRLSQSLEEFVCVVFDRGSAVRCVMSHSNKKCLCPVPVVEERVMVPGSLSLCVPSIFCLFCANFVLVFMKPDSSSIFPFFVENRK